MDLTTRKLNAIEYIARLKDENAFNNIELAILESKVRNGRKLRPLTQKQLLSRAEKSNKEYLTGKYKTQETIERNQKTGKIMKVIWSDFAIDFLYNIYKYYKEVAGENVAPKNKVKNIFCY